MGRPKRHDVAFARRVQEEAPGWAADGLLTVEQAEALQARYASIADTGLARFRQTLLIVIFSVMGVLLVGTGVILVVGANWQFVPPWVKCTLLLLGMLGSYALGYQWSIRTRARPILGAACIFLGTWFYAATIIWICQTFHVRIEAAHYLILWGLPILPLAYLLRSAPILAQAVFTLVLWLFLVIIDKGHPELLAILGVLLLFGVSLLAIGEAHQRRWPYRTLHLPYQWYGLLLTLGAGYVLSFRFVFEYADVTPVQGNTSTALVIVLIAVAVTLSALGLLPSHRPTRTEIGFTGMQALLIVLGGLLVFAPSVFVDPLGSEETISIIPAIFFNVVLAAFIMVTIALGVLRRQHALVSLCFFFFGLLLITRYFDWVWGLMANGIALILGGVILLAISWWLERTRRRLLAMPTAPTEEPAP